MTRTRLSFPNAAGLELDAVLSTPDTTPHSYALYAHCFTCTKEIAAATRTSNELVDQGVAVLRFDFAGLGKSSGDFSHTNFSTNVSDLRHAADQMAEHYRAPALLIGHSLGGAAVLAAAGDIPSIRAVATIGAPSEPAHVQHLFEAEVAKIKEQGAANVDLAGRPFLITQQFVDDIAAYDLKQKLRQMDKALLILHSPADTTVSIDEAATIYRNARQPKSFISLEDADHLLTRREDAAYAARNISAWSSRYL
jgi:alpha-beta hydrolase superfamily lysophospholipase